MPRRRDRVRRTIDLTQVRPTEYRADVVILLLHEAKPVRVIVVEVQLAKDDDKPFTWPAYLTVARDQHRCASDLLVVAPQASVADWCAKPIEVGPPGFVLHPTVLRPNAVPIVTDPAEAARRNRAGGPLGDGARGDGAGRVDRPRPGARVSGR